MSRSMRTNLPRSTRTVGGVTPEPCRNLGAVTAYLPGGSAIRYVPSSVVTTRAMARPLRWKTTSAPRAGLLHGRSSMQTGEAGESVTAPRKPELGADPGAGTSIKITTAARSAAGMVPG